MHGILSSEDVTHHFFSLISVPLSSVHKTYVSVFFLVVAVVGLASHPSPPSPPCPLTDTKCRRRPWPSWPHLLFGPVPSNGRPLIRESRVRLKALFDYNPMEDRWVHLAPKICSRTLSFHYRFQIRT